MMKTTQKDIIGHIETASFPDIAVFDVPVKIDTGADSSSLWASSIEQVDDEIKVVFFNPESDYYSGKVYTFAKSEYKTSIITNSFGHKERRYKLKLRININGRLINGSFTLSNRSGNKYPVLIGKKLLRGKFLVDVSHVGSSNKKIKV